MLFNYEKLSNVIVNHSCSLKKGDKVFISANNVDQEFLGVLLDEIYNAGAYPFYFSAPKIVGQKELEYATEEFVDAKCKYYSYIMNDMDAYIGISANDNKYQDKDLNKDIQKMYGLRFVKPVHFEIRVPKTKWVIMQYPTDSFAQSSKMSTRDFAKYYEQVCTLDYEKMGEAMTPLKELMERTDKVRITANNTDITFSIKGMTAIKCDGRFNLPDGEIYTAPIRNSVNGHIEYNVLSMNRGIEFENVHFVVKDGKIVSAECKGKTKELNEILDSDEGARYFGEFALGVNPYVIFPINDILFDEKMSGSIHLTPGGCYDDADNGNKSSVHWDLVQSHTPENGGGEIWFDNVLIRKNGVFVLENLQGLNPDNLK